MTTKTTPPATRMKRTLVIAQRVIVGRGIMHHLPPLSGWQKALPGQAFNIDSDFSVGNQLVSILRCKLSDG